MIISPLIGSYIDARAAHRKILFLTTFVALFQQLFWGSGVDDMKLAIFSLFYRIVPMLFIKIQPPPC